MSLALFLATPLLSILRNSSVRLPSLAPAKKKMTQPAALSGVKICIVGSGVCGSSAAFHLSRLQDVSISVFDCGRGPGGRTATRFSRSLPGVSFNHGTPFFAAQCDEATEVLERMVERQLGLGRYEGRRMVLDASSGEMRDAPDEGPQYVGSPHMNSWCEAMLSSNPRITQTYSKTLVEITYDPAKREFSLRDDEDGVYAGFGVVLLTSVATGEERGLSFDLDPSLRRLGASLRKEGVPSDVDRLVNAMAKVRSDKTQTLMLAYPTEAAVPFDCLMVENDPILSKIVILPRQQGLLCLVAHCTRGYANQFTHLAPPTSVPGKEYKPPEELAGTLRERTEGVLRRVMPSAELPAPVMCQLQQWGAAFAVEGPEEARGDGCLWDGCIGLGVGGDFCGEPLGSCESALLCGRALAMKVEGWLREGGRDAASK
ncbi:unnamed protein product [Vitrella brassicaformis CCMP3155]|uniref:Amine oxidase domain-containing protein n=2 Tax=Vitrella brassicaformis TaxID=1169539 RepID=A0A0G4EHA9_VITBC|nr:unnamed protein product [Vitrella brassicaformis CCMP3155]|mmetsp:Transcript_20795/g.59332  ORF Transcript_20795/g.59332 Transcript_20795/m.59332 type:complete len:429 (-) Transcript_20795:257-1543(-)|eukprot:CEL95410.1 unnamed protein product [Vitrella brassicaformis CCMP3155]